MAVDQNTEAMIELLEEVVSFLDESESTPWATSEPQELSLEIKSIIEKLRNSNVQGLGTMKSHFLPTGTLQEISMRNNWDSEYLELASDFDSLYHRIINAKPGKSLTT